jgi:NADH dehydrogenase [ubiquinone] 1 alpha subcomplex assembly factor 7
MLIYISPLIIINNELFDALPSKQFIYKENAWREVMVDIVRPEDKNNKIQLISNDTRDEAPNKIEFKYSYSAPNTESVTRYLQPDTTFGQFGIQPKENETYEFSIEQVRYMYSICYLLATTRLSQALICDYGEDQAFSNSFRAIKKQKLYKGDDILKYTGECDLSFYVNFKALKKVVSTYHGNLKFGGLMKQGDFLEVMQMYERMQALQNKTNNFKHKDAIAKQFDRLTLEDQMGDTYKFMYIHKNHQKPCYPFTQDVFDYIEKINTK